MASFSELARLYLASFEVPPSAMSAAALLRMEQLLGLTQDDPLARMLIVQLRVADQVHASLKQRSQQEKDFVRDIRQLKGELHPLIAKVGDARAKVGLHRGVRRDWGGGDPAAVEIDTYRKASPLWSYLTVAFHKRNGVDDTDERIGMARLDLLYVIAVAAALLFGGMAVARLAG
jgi:hypothetical protein